MIAQVTIIKDDKMDDKLKDKNNIKGVNKAQVHDMPAESL